MFAYICTMDAYIQVLCGLYRYCVGMGPCARSNEDRSLTFAYSVWLCAVHDLLHALNIILHTWGAVGTLLGSGGVINP